uniref:solute carrier family 49 member 4 homolog isoform X2 n=1 Tax=Styela clava TaxID=7725 RepID=UPI00193A5F38|nr:solute carrier family 49 member 4 homolog isoform X2 [Styela clava]
MSSPRWYCYEQPDDYDLLSNWAPIGIMTTMPFFIWLINNKGARLSVIFGGTLVAMGTGLRCIPLPSSTWKYFIHAGQLLSAIAGCPVLGAAPLISNTWFPPNERVFATSCMVLIGNIGNAASFLIGPAIVNRPNNCTGGQNLSTTTHATYTDRNEVMTNVTLAPIVPLTTTSCSDNTEEMRKQIKYYLYGEFAIAVLILVSIVISFQNKPDVPPSVSAGIERLDILAGLKTLSKKYSFWVVTISFALACGAFYGWFGIVTVLMTPHNVSETEVGNVAFVMTICGSVLGILTGWFADRIKGKLKWLLFSCYIIMAVVFLYLAIIILDWINVPPFKFTKAGFWVSFILFGSLSSVIQPLGMELTADIAYPVSEGTSISVVTWFIMLSMFIFLLILNSVPNQDISMYLVLIFTGLAAPFLAMSAKNENVRLELDKNTRTSNRHNPRSIVN